MLDSNPIAIPNEFLVSVIHNLEDAKVSLTSADMRLAQRVWKISSKNSSSCSSVVRARVKKGKHFVRAKAFTRGLRDKASAEEDVLEYLMAKISNAIRLNRILDHLS